MTAILATSGLAWFLWVALIIAVDLLFIVVTMNVAARKGHGPLLWGIVAVFIPVIALLVVLVLPPREPAV